VSNNPQEDVTPRLKELRELFRRCYEQGEAKLLDVIEHGQIRKGWRESRVLHSDFIWVVVKAAVSESTCRNNTAVLLDFVVGDIVQGTLAQLTWQTLIVQIPPRQNYDIATLSFNWQDDWVIEPGEILLYGWELPFDG